MELPKIKALDADLTERMLPRFKGVRKGWVKVGDKEYLFPSRYAEQVEGYYKFKIRPSDTWVMSYPRSGTTWTQELVWLLANDLDYRSSATRYLADRFPFLEFSVFNYPEVTEEFVKMNAGDIDKQSLCREISKEGYKMLEKLPSPRFIKTHFPLSLLPGILDSGCKIVYVARNPKDVAVSWYHMNRAIRTQGYQGDFKEFWNYFRNDLTPWSPYWEHLKEAWSQRHHPNLLFIFYEEMQWVTRVYRIGKLKFPTVNDLLRMLHVNSQPKDLQRMIHRVAKFLGKSYSDEEVSKLADYLDIKNFRDNPMVNMSELRECGIIEPGKFVRQGKSGAWVDTFTEELEASADSWIEDNLRDTDLVFPYIGKDGINNNKTVSATTIRPVDYEKLLPRVVEAS